MVTLLLLFSVVIVVVIIVFVVVAVVVVISINVVVVVYVDQARSDEESRVIDQSHSLADDIRLFSASEVTT